MADAIRIARINVTPVKALGLQHPEAVDLTLAGVPENRRFYLVSGGRLFNGKDHGPLVQVVPRFDGDTLELVFPDRGLVAGEVRLGQQVETDFWGRPVRGHLVEGPWSEALSDYVGAAIGLVKTVEPGTGIDVHVGTLVGRASCDRLGEELGGSVDARRFRMLLEVEETTAHEEDGWADRHVRAGDAVLRVGGPVPRCAITTQDPDTGVVDLDTLRAIKSYRGLSAGKQIDFGVYFDVVEPGRVAVGDALELV